MNNLGQVFHQAEVGSHGISQSCQLTKFGQQGNLIASPSVLVDKKRLVHVGNGFVVPSLVVLLVACWSPILVEGGGWALSKIDSVNLVGLLVVASDHSSSSESLLDSLLSISTSLLDSVSSLAHVVEAVVRSHDFEAYVDVEKDACLFHDQTRVKARPDLDVVSVQAVSILLVETLLANSLKFEAAHH